MPNDEPTLAGVTAPVIPAMVMVASPTQSGGADPAIGASPELPPNALHFLSDSGPPCRSISVD